MPSSFFGVSRPWVDSIVARCEHPLDALAGGAPLVETHADADVAVALALGETVGLDLAQGAPLEVGQFEILEHDLDQFVERDVGLIVVNAGAIAGLALALPLTVLAGLADDLSGLRIAVTLGGTGSILAVDETVFLDPAKWDLDDLVFVFADDRFFGDDVGDIFADGLADFLAMAQTIAGRAIGALGIGDAVFAKDGVTHTLRFLAFRQAPSATGNMRRRMPKCSQILQFRHPRS